MKIKKKVILDSLESAGHLYKKEMPAAAAALWLHNILELKQAAVSIQEEVREDTKEEAEERMEEILRNIEEEEMELPLERIPVGMMGECRVSPRLLHRVLFLLG